MGQLVTTVLCVMALLVVPLGVLQIHAVLQMRSELLEISFAAAKYLSNRGGTGDADVRQAVEQFLREELSHKVYRLVPDEVGIAVSRTVAADPLLWSHGDVFRLRLTIPYPMVTPLFSQGQRPISVERIGTINVMDYDLEGE